MAGAQMLTKVTTNFPTQGIILGRKANWQQASYFVRHQSYGSFGPGKNGAGRLGRPPSSFQVLSCPTPVELELKRMNHVRFFIGNTRLDFLRQNKFHQMREDKGNITAYIVGIGAALVFLHSCQKSLYAADEEGKLMDPKEGTHNQKSSLQYKMINSYLLFRNLTFHLGGICHSGGVIVVKVTKPNGTSSVPYKNNLLLPDAPSLEVLVFHPDNDIPVDKIARSLAGLTGTQLQDMINEAAVELQRRISDFKKHFAYDSGKAAEEGTHPRKTGGTQLGESLARYLHENSIEMLGTHIYGILESGGLIVLKAGKVSIGFGVGEDVQHQDAFIFRVKVFRQSGDVAMIAPYNEENEHLCTSI